MSYGEWDPYVSVATRRANAAMEASKLTKKGKSLQPIQISGRKIATTFWGMAWCDNLESYADWANRMSRGRTYARNGSIVDLQIETGKVTALVSGSSLYKIKIIIDKLAPKTWKAIREDCSQHVGSLLDLMRGKLPESVLTRLTNVKNGMFPHPKELMLKCSCPDYAFMCKHLAATLYGVGHLLDTQPDLFFKLRGVQQSDLVAEAMSTQSTSDVIGLEQQSDLCDEDLGALFGIEMATSNDVQTPKVKMAKGSKQSPKAKTSKNKATQSMKSPKATKSSKLKVEPLTPLIKTKRSRVQKT
jgi:uncharacterized Zn finger protein